MDSSLKQLVDLANGLLKQADVGREYTMDYVIQRCEAALDKYPHDSVIQQVASVLNKQANKGKLITSQKELYSVYNSFARMNNNSMVKELLGDLLYPYDNSVKTKVGNETEYSYRATLPELDLTIEHNPLENLFDKQVSINTAYYDPTLAKLGKHVLSEELDSIGIPATEINVSGGNDSAIVYEVIFINKLGTARVPIFVEVANGIQPPTHFYTKNQFIQLTAENLNKCIVEKAQIEEDIQINNIGGVRTASSMILPSFSFEEDAPTQIQLDKVEMPEALKNLASFETAIMDAGTNFAPELVRTAKSLCIKELNNMGFRTQVCLAEATDNCIICAAELDSSVGKVEIRLPVEIVDNRPQIPSLFYNESAKDKIYDFTKNDVANYLTSMKSNNGHILRYSNDIFNMTYTQLKDEVLTGVAHKDYLRAESALNRIEDKYPEQHLTALTDYAKYLSYTTHLEEKPQYKCKLLVTKGGVEPRCGHYNVVLSKVATDASGNCELLERKAKYDNLAESTGTLIRSNKVVLT
jgi:hypothetical protein